MEAAAAAARAVTVAALEAAVLVAATTVNRPAALNVPKNHLEADTEAAIVTEMAVRSVFVDSKSRLGFWYGNKFTL